MCRSATAGPRQAATENRSDLLDEIQARLTGGGDPDIKEIRAFVEDHPFLSVIGLLIGGEPAKRLVELLARQDEQLRVLADALQELPGLGWAISSHVPIDAYRDILSERPDGSTSADLDAALDTAWNDSSILGALPARIRILGAGDDDLQSIATQRLASWNWRGSTTGRGRTRHPCRSCLPKWMG